MCRAAHHPCNDLRNSRTALERYRSLVVTDSAVPGSTLCIIVLDRETAFEHVSMSTAPSEDPTLEPPEWIQCDNCDKWRQLPAEYVLRCKVRPCKFGCRKALLLLHHKLTLYLVLYGRMVPGVAVSQDQDVVVQRPVMAAKGTLAPAQILDAGKTQQTLTNVGCKMTNQKHIDSHLQRFVWQK